MASSKTQGHRRNGEFEYLCVDSFIKNLVEARSLATAFEIGLIDFLIENKECTFDSMQKQLKVDRHGIHLLIGLLLTNQVVESCDERLRLSREFVRALKYRDLLELKLKISNLAAHDFLNCFSDLVYRPEQFVNKVSFIKLFSYDKCFKETKENYELTKRWMRITTTYTKYEAQVLMKYHDFSRYRRILDIGGNSGEFALQICRRYPGVSATVFDLPLVCDIGLEHIRSGPEADRISFIKGNGLTDDFPKGFDLVIFKSMLHDWPEKEAKQFILKASQSLEPGGTLLIFERGPFEITEEPLFHSMIPFLLFFRSFRSPNIYEEHLKGLGFQAIGIEKITLETPFYLVTAAKKI